jgi:hypothetical protein
VLFVEDQLAVLPANISWAQLDISVTAAGPGSVVIRADSLVAWTQPRPTKEFVPARDRVVILSVTHLDGSKGKRVVATKAGLVDPIVSSFNQQRLVPPTFGGGECTPGARLSYQIAFASTPNAMPDVVATIDHCPLGVAVRARDRTLPMLEGSGAFSDSLAHLLGASELPYP